MRERLAQAQHATAQRLADLGFELFAEPGCGMVLWARHPDIADSAELSNRAAESDIMLGPGHLFMPDLQPTAWMRFNVAFCNDERLFAFLEQHRRGLQASS